MSDSPPRPARRLMLELSAFYYAIGNSAARDLLGPVRAAKRTDASALLLGCGDPRHVLLSLAESADAPALQRFSFTLNDNNPDILARAALLLHLAATATTPAEVEEVWEVWYNVQLSPAAAARLRSATAALQSGAVTTAWLELDATAAQHVRAVWRRWATALGDSRSSSDGGSSSSTAGGGGGGASSVREVLATRTAWLAKHWGDVKQRAAALPTPPLTAQQLHELQSELALLMASALCVEMPFTNNPAFTRLSDECLSYLRCGSALPSGVAPTPDAAGAVPNPTLMSTRFACTAGRQGQAGPSGSAGQSCDGAATVLGATWRLHYDSVPFPSYAPFSKAALCGGERLEPSRGALTRACLEALRRRVAAMQRTLKRAQQVRVVLCLGDAVTLCASPQLQGAFDVVDSSNLADHVGLPHILLPCRRLLSPELHARLYTETFTWITVAADVASYLRFYGLLPTLCPTVLGLRLLTDLSAGRPTPLPLTASLGTIWSSDCRRLEWLRTDARCEPSPPRMLPSDGAATSGGAAAAGQPAAASGPPQLYTDSLRRLQELCCANDLNPTERCGAFSCTPHTLALLLAGALARASLPTADAAAQPPPAELKRELLLRLRSAAGPGGALGVPAQFALCFRAALCCLAASLELAAASSHTAAAAAAAASAACEPLGPPLRFSAALHCNELLRDVVGTRATPLLRLVLLPGRLRGGDGAMHAVALQSALRSLQQPGSGGGANQAQQGERGHVATAYLDDIAEHGGGGGGGGMYGSVHFIDAVHVEEVDPEDMDAPLRVSFLLPPDHGLHVDESTVLLIAANTLSSAFPLTEPLPLSAFTAVPDAAAAYAWPQEPTAGGNRGGEGSGGGQLRLVLRRFEESAERYSATVAMEGSGGEPSGLSVAFDEVDGCSSSRHLTLTLAKPAPAQLRVSFAFPVVVGSSEIKLIRKQRLITGTFEKAFPYAVWPEDGDALRPKINPDALEAWPKDQMKDVGTHAAAMFDRAAMMSHMQGYAGEGPSSGDVLRDVKESIKILFVRAIEGTYVHALKKSRAEEDAEYYIRVHPPIRRLPDGRPALVCTVVDYRLAEKVTASSAARKMEEVQAFSSHVLNAANGCMNGIFCSPLELKLLGQYLEQWRALAKPSSWQRRNLKLGGDSPWSTALVVPVYTESYGAGSEAAATYNAFTSLVGQLTETGGAAAGLGPTSPAAAFHAAFEANYAAARAEKEAEAGRPQEQEQVATCSGCGVRAGPGQSLLRCGRCKKARYCSQNCQRQHWPMHKAECG